MAWFEALRRLTRRGGLRAKMIAWVLLPTGIILAAVGGVAFYASQQITEDLVLDRNRDRTRLLANQLSADLEAYRRPLGTVAAGASEAPLYQLQAALDREWPAGDLEVFDAGVMVIDQDGTVVAALPNWLHLYGQRFPALAVESTRQGSERLGFTDILFEKLGGIDVIALRYPVTDGAGDIRGSVVGLFQADRRATRTSWFYRNIWELYVGRRETAYLVDGNGRVIFHQDTFFIGEDFSHLDAVERALGGETDAIRTRDVDERDVVAGFTPVPRTSWGLVTEEHWSEVTDALLPYSRFMLVLLGLGAVVPVVVVALGMRRITRPVAELTRAAERVAAGHFDQRIEVSTGDELETLAEQFNAMAEELQASYAHLEQRVEDRTRELATLNAIAAVVSRSLELDEIMEAALKETLVSMDIEAGAAFRLDDQRMRLMAHVGLSDSFVFRVESLSLEDSIAAQAVSEVAPVVRPVTDYPEGALKELLEDEGLRSVVSVPLVAKGETLGVLNLATRRTRAITPEERSLLASIGQQAGMAVDNARLYEDAEAAAAAAERNRLARELHDAVSQTLFSASMIADVLPRLWERDQDEARRRLDMLRRLTRGAMAEMRTLLLELRPAALVEAELDELLAQLGKAVEGRAQVDVQLKVERVSGLPDDVKVALYRIAQEGLNNVTKHASAGRIDLSLRVSREGVELRIRDDGRGFDPGDVPRDHFGLINMYERAESVGAELTLKSEIGRGTEISVVWREADPEGTG
jgi:two-component system nitrate/nitrite sensor histidine kinase NarX